MRWRYDTAELWADGVVHVAGVALAAIGSAALLAMAAGSVSPSDVAGFGVYAICLVTTLMVSAAYNMWPVSPVKWVLRRVDHACIFLLIAGTYTPLTLQMGRPGAWLLAWVWGVAIIGMVLKILFAGRFDRLAVFFYLALGWSGIAFIHVMLAQLAPETLVFILLGGFAYTGGVVFHLLDRLRFQNAIWHGFVLAGAGLHYVAVLGVLQGLA